MFPRFLKAHTVDLLDQFPAVAVLGPRQVGKTTLALEIAEETDALYLDLEHLTLICSSCDASNLGAKTAASAW